MARDFVMLILLLFGHSSDRKVRFVQQAICRRQVFTEECWSGIANELGVGESASVFANHRSRSRRGVCTLVLRLV